MTRLTSLQPRSQHKIQSAWLGCRPAAHRHSTRLPLRPVDGILMKSHEPFERESFISSCCCPFQSTFRLSLSILAIKSLSSSSSSTQTIKMSFAVRTDWSSACIQHVFQLFAISWIAIKTKKKMKMRGEKRTKKKGSFSAIRFEYFLRADLIPVVDNDELGSFGCRPFLRVGSAMISFSSFLSFWGYVCFVFVTWHTVQGFFFIPF